MAAKKQQSNNKKFTHTQVGDILNKLSKSNSLIIEDNNNRQESEFVPTGNYLLNALFSKSIINGGIPTNRITALAGESGVGKSFLCYNICREAQKKGYNVIYIDTEFSIEIDDLPKFGVDTSEERFKLVRSNVIEDLRTTLTNLLGEMKNAKKEGHEIDKTIIFLDSVGMLASRKEVDDAREGKEKADMTRAKVLSSMFRIITSDLGYLNIPLVATNHTYEDMSLFPQEIMKGGKALYYAASTVIFLNKAKLKTGNEDEFDMGQSGIKVTAKSKKNRIAKPKKIKFEIDFEKGSNPYTGLEAFCRPDFFEQVGIAKGKMELEKVVDKETGEEKKEHVFKPGGNQYYVRHLDKKIKMDELHTSKVFTPEVLQALEPIIYDYFRYKSREEMEKLSDQLEEQTQENQSYNSSLESELFNEQNDSSVNEFRTESDTGSEEDNTNHLFENM